MLIFVEGADGAGKTTLCKHLVQTNDICMLELHTLDTAPMIYEEKHNRAASYRLKEREVYHILDNATRDNDHVYIMDRGILSDVIYRKFDSFAPVIHEESLLTYLQGKTDSIGVVYCENEFQRRCAIGDHNPIVHEHYDALVEEYRKLMRKLRDIGMSVFTYDYSVFGRADIVKWISRLQEGRL